MAGFVSCVEFERYAPPLLNSTHLCCLCNCFQEAARIKLEAMEPVEPGEEGTDFGEDPVDDEQAGDEEGALGGEGGDEDGGEDGEDGEEEGDPETEDSPEPKNAAAKDDVFKGCPAGLNGEALRNWRTEQLVPRMTAQETLMGTPMSDTKRKATRLMGTMYAKKEARDLENHKKLGFAKKEVELALLVRIGTLRKDSSRSRPRYQGLNVPRSRDLVTFVSPVGILTARPCLRMTVVLVARSVAQ
jgi:hypothetical protein